MVTAVFSDNSNSAFAHGLWQWDYGQILRIQGLSLPPAVEIQFSLQETGGESTTRIGVTKDGVTDVVIPDSMLEGGIETRKDIYYAYAFIYIDDGNSGKTVKKIIMDVKLRPKPEAFSGSDDTTLGNVIDSLNKFAESKADEIQIDGDKLRLKSNGKVIDEIEMNIDGGTFEDWRNE